MNNSNLPRKVVLASKFQQFSAHWTPKIIGETNGQLVKIAKVKGEFVWHAHDDEDELFLVIKGKLTIEFRDGKVELNPGEMCIVPRGVEHKPVADEEAQILLIEPASTEHTGRNISERTVSNDKQEWI